MSIPILVALCAALVVVVILVRSHQAGAERRKRHSDTIQRQRAERRQQVPYVSASLRGLAEHDPKRRNGGLREG
jgi:hypothetical protein